MQNTKERGEFKEKSTPIQWLHMCRVPAQKIPFGIIKQWCEARRHKLKEMLLP